MIRRYRQLIADSAEELGAILAVGLGPPVPFLPERWHGRPVCGVILCWTGPEDQDDRVRAMLAELGPVLGQHVGRIPYPVINTLFDELVPPGLFHYWKGTFSEDLPDGLIDAHVEFGAATPSIQSVTIVFPIDGACGRVGRTDTAFSYRDALFSTALNLTMTNREDMEAQKDWIRGYYAALEPYSADGGGYVNFMDGDDQGKVRANYRENSGRLRELKRRYDPGNLFRLNHNIAP